MQRTFQATFTNETNLLDLVELEKFNLVFNKAERSLYKDLYQNKKSSKTDKNQLKQDYQKNFGINARHYNSVKSSIEGKANSILALNKDYLKDTEDKLNKAIKDRNYQSKKIKELRSDLKKLNEVKTKDKVSGLTLSRDETETNITVKALHKYKTKIYWTNNRIIKLEKKIVKLKSDIEENNPRICFGTRKLFKQQYLIGTNNNKTKLVTINDWKDSLNYHRNKTFSLVGSKDETAGNLNCQLIKSELGGYELIVNLPNGRVTFPIKIHNGKDAIDSVISGNLSKDKNLWQAITFRFYKLNKPTKSNKLGWKIFISVDMDKITPPISSDKQNGAIGIDINADHLAVSEVDCRGNLIKSFNIELNLKGKSTNFVKSHLGNQIKTLMDFAKSKNKPIIIEDLDFSKKKQALKSGFNKKYNQMLSSLAYNKIISLIEARSFDNGIEVIKVNPAFTSIIGKYKYQTRLKLTVHQSAAFVIARRGLFIKEYTRTCLVEYKNKETNIITKSIKEKKFISIKKEKPITNLTKIGYKLNLSEQGIARINQLGSNQSLWKNHSDYWKLLSSSLSRKSKVTSSKGCGRLNTSHTLKVITIDKDKTIDRGTVPLTETSGIHIPF